MADRFFNLQEAESLLPALKELLCTAMRHKKKVEAFDAEFANLNQRIHLEGGIVVDYPRLADLRLEKDNSVQQLYETLRQIESRGCLVKDLEVGLIDFPCVVDEREIYLCWKLGESHVGFWHDTEEGFAGRKPIDRQWIEGQRTEGKVRPN
jgi:hypothetical protein